MIDIFVIRGAGDRRGPDIVDPLITSVSVALARGQVEMDKATPARTTQLTCRHRTGLRPRQMVRVVDALQGEAWVGKIVSVDNGVELTKLSSKITVERVHG